MVVAWSIDSCFVKIASWEFSDAVFHDSCARFFDDTGGIIGRIIDRQILRAS